MEELKPESFFDLSGLTHSEVFRDIELVWEVLDRIKDYIRETIRPNVAVLRKSGDVLQRTCVLYQGQVLCDDLELIPGDATKGNFAVRHKGQLLDGATVVYAGAALMSDEIELGPGVVVEPGALIKGPTIIGKSTEVRQGAYIRGSCLVGRACVVGHVTEMKNSIMLDGAKAGHFAYLGDSVLGRNVNLGAGTKLANLKIMPLPFRVKVGDRVFNCERRKFGAIIADNVEMGCNSVTSPGTLLAAGCLVTPNVTVPSGYHPGNSLINGDGPREKRARKYPNQNR